MPYTVKSGDTLGKIAVTNGISVSDIINANPNITDPDNIRIGQSIIIPKYIYKQPTNSTKGVSTQGGRIPGVCGLFSYAADKLDNYHTPIKALANSFFECRFFDRKKFFDGYRDKYGKLTQSQVDGINELLGFIENDDDITDITHVAYMFSTVKHETADRFKPITEFGNKEYFNKYDPVLANTNLRKATAKKYGNITEGDGYKYRGRGYVQITWKNNYKKLGDAVGRNLIVAPDDALKSEIAYKIMSYGMRKGSFTGKKLSDYLSGDKINYKNSRKIINGLDKAVLIKGYAEEFEKVLKKSIIK